MTVSEAVPSFKGGWGHANGLVNIRVAEPLADLAALRDRLAIEQVIMSYGWCIDEKQFDVLRDLLTEDMAFTGCIASVAPFDPLVGREVFVPWLEAFMATREDQLRHNLGNIVVTEQTATDATAVAYLTLTSSTVEGARILATAFYRLALIKRGDFWQISAMYGAFDSQF